MVNIKQLGFTLPRNKMITNLENTQRNTPQNKDPTQNFHSNFEQPNND